MSVAIHQKLLDHNYDKELIPVEFLVLHYTSASFSKTLEIFENPKSLASAHIVVTKTGTIYELVKCLKGQCFKAWHAGESRWLEQAPTAETKVEQASKSPAKTIKPKLWKGFNNFSIGIELVNKNGNLFEYSHQQYMALKVLIKKLKSYYPALRQPERILGHEHIAHHRGKIDPGRQFNWPLFFKTNYPQHLAPIRKATLNNKQYKILLKKAQALSQKKTVTDQDWMRLSG